METTKTSLTPPWYILPTIIVAQFTGTSLWFAGNAVLVDLQASYGLPDGALAGMTSAVQLGFIIGTLIFAALLIADRFSPSLVFLASALLGAAFNLGVGTLASSYPAILSLRFLTGFCLAGIYPVGMKIASDWYAKDLGKALGYLVGALVLGTAFPHLLRFTTADFHWQSVMQGTSALAAAGGIAIWQLVPDGPYHKRSQGFDPGAITSVFHHPNFRAAALGYFGHMWELYAFWAFVPIIVATKFPALSERMVSFYAFIIIALGALSCIVGGYWSIRKGSARVALVMLTVSGLMCIFSPWLFSLPPALFMILLMVWGLAVIGDSPQFSTLVAQNAPAETRGSALTIVNSLGFAITIVSIQLLSLLYQSWPPESIYWVLCCGPLLGILGARRLLY